MPVTIQKKLNDELVVTLPTQEDVKTEHIQQVVDAYGQKKKELEAHLEELEPLVNAVKEMEKDLQAFANTEYPADEAVELEGKEFAVKLGPRAKQALVTDKDLLRDLLGDETFFELAKVNIGDIRKYLTPPEVEQVLDEKQSGSRSLKLRKA